MAGPVRESRDSPIAPFVIAILTIAIAICLYSGSTARCGHGLRCRLRQAAVAYAFPQGTVRQPGPSARRARPPRAPATALGGGAVTGSRPARAGRSGGTQRTEAAAEHLALACSRWDRSACSSCELRRKGRTVSYDLMVFEPAAAPKDRQSFIEWYHDQTNWTELHSYDDPKATTP